MSPQVVLLLSLLTAGDVPPVDFDTQVMPILTQSGCNSGACHGAAAGRGGLHLSLYGSDAAADFAALTGQWEGRRIDLSRPERSLFFRKPTADLDHGGDQRFQPDSDSAELLLRWIHEGAERKQRRRLLNVTVSPERYVARQTGERFSPLVTATFDDDTTADVSGWSVLTPEDPAALRANEDGSVQILRRGSHLLLVRYLDRMVPVRVMLRFADGPVETAVAQHANPIDRFLRAQFETLALEVSPRADDRAFLRRICLDLTGRLPASEQVAAFRSDDANAGRVRLIDELLASDEFVTYWTFEFAKLLRLRPVAGDVAAAETFHDWLRAQFAARTPCDVIARELIMAEGDSHTNGPANFHRVVSGPREQAEFVSEVFMGVRLKCANCHDHPLDHWTQDDYHGLSAIFARMQRGRVVGVGERGEVSHPKTQEAALPRIPGTRFLPAGVDARAELADWLTSPENPYFARAFVNRIWRHLMGRGLVEPVDDLRVTNPGTQPELLDWLARDFISHRYDLRHTIRIIVTSAAYQRSSEPAGNNTIDDRFYSHYLAEPLEPEVLADAVADVTGVPFRYAERDAGTRAIQLLDPRTAAPSLDVLGRCDRDESCETLPQAGGVGVKLHLLNGPFLNAAISSPRGRLSQMMTAGIPACDVVEAFYVHALSRPPGDTERTFWEQQFDRTDDDDRPALAEDFLWSLLSSREFTTNH